MPTLIAAAPKAKSFSFSYSKLKGFEVCPRRYYEVDVKKAWPEPRSEQLAWGDEVHLAMAKALKNGGELPLQFTMYQHWVDKVARTKGELLVEDQCKWAITRRFEPTAWFGQNVWCRSMADATKLDEDVALIVDWKTCKSQNVDEVQLILCSLVAFAQYPKIQKIRADFVWLQEDTQTTMVIDRHEAADQWAEILPRVERLERATMEENFPPTPNNFCRSYCPVKTCEYWGK